MRIKTNMRRLTYLPWVCLLLCSLACSGCGPSRVPVSGKVLYSDQRVIPAGKIYIQLFSESSKDKQNLVSSGTVDVTTGAFKDLTTRAGPGVLRGKHKVVILATDPSGYKGSKEVPQEYSSPDTTPLTVEVTKANQELQILIPKPEKTSSNK